MLIRSHACSVLLQEVSNDIGAMTLALCTLALFLDAKPLEALDQLATVLGLDPDNGRAMTLRDRIEEVVRLKGDGDEAFQKNDYQTAIASWADALMVNEVLCERVSEGRGGTLRARLPLNRATGLHKLEGCQVDLEQFEAAAEDFRATLKHGKASLNGADKRGIEAELEGAERRAKLQKIKEQDHYAALRLAASCTMMDVKKAYRTLSLKHHPDRGGVAEKFSQIARAYAVLSDPDQKSAYDAKLQSPSPDPSTQPMQHGSW
ncbi:transporter [Ganoderma sinense ZZ0214-1]|uniref:Transporter n=1 Tax=Ganoderma sinense ZZ0214-1 TaxID=1077348 RepID=A0A2G8SQL0_9APHY|nr:transporter [Ganoderma sinense ZZ0214-1]